MTDSRMLLEQAARCRRIARICTSDTIARKFEALAHDYEEHARLLRSGGSTAQIDAPVELREPTRAEPSTR
jgi:hypothetical protein